MARSHTYRTRAIPTVGDIRRGRCVDRECEGCSDGRSCCWIRDICVGDGIIDGDLDDRGCRRVAGIIRGDRVDIPCTVRESRRVEGDRIRRRSIRADGCRGYRVIRVIVIKLYLCDGACIGRIRSDREGRSAYRLGCGRTRDGDGRSDGIARIRDTMSRGRAVAGTVGNLDSDDLRSRVVSHTGDTRRDEVGIREGEYPTTIGSLGNTRGGTVDDDLDGCICFDRTRDIHGRVGRCVDGDGRAKIWCGRSVGYIRGGRNIVRHACLADFDGRITREVVCVEGDIVDSTVDEG